MDSPRAENTIFVFVIDVCAIRQRFAAVSPFLDERGRRLVAAAEAVAAGDGGIAAVAAATGVAPSTIGRGLAELSGGEDLLAGRVRRPGGKPAGDLRAKEASPAVDTKKKGTGRGPSAHGLVPWGFQEQWS